MTNAQRLYNQTCRHLQAVQANIDRLAELGANEKLALLCGRLQRLSFRAAPAPTESALLVKTPFWPTRPPAMTPASDWPFGIPLTDPNAETLVMLPAFCPATTPTNWPGSPALGLAKMLTLVSVRLLMEP